MRMPSSATLRVAILVLPLALAACASKPRTPDWQMNAHASAERFVQAYLSGQARVDVLEFDRARAETARTGQPKTVARIELLRCAVRAASLVFEPCAGFEVLRQDAAAPERAYADFLAGRLQPQDIALLTPAQRGVAAASAEAAPAALAAIADPLARLVAAAVLLRTGRASPGVMVLAVDTASAQGWRRPLLAWLGVQEQRALQAGDTTEAQRLRRRMELVLKTP
ncbi:MAG: hypothetical protein Q8K31_06205 [Burkholderiaceae bacterium]|nr:hypothetical protein [Burkholderiaceae bacterium]MDP1968761.1 hypothetical protein [Burkholderiaceae bacterium]